MSRQNDPVLLRGLIEHLLDDLRTARDRLNQRPDNSSRPSGSMAPWQRGSGAPIDAPSDDESHSHDEGLQGDPPADPSQPKTQQPTDSSPTDAPAPDTQSQAMLSAQAPTPKRPGRRIGAPGHGRKQHLEPTCTQEHRPMCCAACQRTFPLDEHLKAWTGWDTLEMIPLSQSSVLAPCIRTGAKFNGALSLLGVHIEVTRHLLMEQSCGCGHTTRAQAARADADTLWPGVAISEQRLLGPRLAAAIVHLCVRMRLPRRKVSELLFEWFGLQLSAALIDQTVHQAARSSAPLEAQLVEQIEQAVLVHADETSWLESGKGLWLWVLCCTHTVLYVIGARTKEMFNNTLSTAFGGTLMSDGYGVYRARPLRLRCWAHLHRKLRGLAESTDRGAAQAGAPMLKAFEALMRAVFEAREQLAQPPPQVSHAAQIKLLHQLCQENRDAAHEKLRAIAREFLNDWEVIVRPLAEPALPLTNNAAERQLRHYVIARRISYGTRTAVGSHSVALLASIIDTCRLRGASATDLLARVIHAARLGLPIPGLPPIPTTLANALVNADVQLVGA